MLAKAFSEFRKDDRVLIYAAGLSNSLETDPRAFARAAVVMPTYFGPTNLPPLEAWALGKPLVYSSCCAEHAGDAAILAGPDDAEQLARAIQEALDPATAARLGTLRLQQVEQQRTQAELELIRRLQQFKSRRECWE